MLPLKADNPSTSALVVTVGLISLYLLVFLYQLPLEISRVLVTTSRVRGALRTHSMSSP